MRRPRSRALDVTRDTGARGEFSMKTLALALGGLAAAWMASPAVSLAVHGTIDDRTRAGWRGMAARATPPPAPLVVIPSPRRGQVGTRASA